MQGISHFHTNNKKGKCFKENWLTIDITQVTQYPNSTVHWHDLLTSCHFINLLPLIRASGTVIGLSWTTWTPGLAPAISGVYMGCLSIYFLHMTRLFLGQGKKGSVLFISQYPCVRVTQLDFHNKTENNIFNSSLSRWKFEWCWVLLI